MNFKGSSALSRHTPPPLIKPEPIEQTISHPLTPSRLQRGVNPSSASVNVKSEAPGTPSTSTVKQEAPRTPPDIRQGHPSSAPIDNVPPPPPYEKFTKPEDIEYRPERALEVGLAMVEETKRYVSRINLSSKNRQDVWKREIESLQNQGAPTTMIAICGATGAGKSSMLNAILDDNIVPTSGMRACTAVVTEISHHASSTIEGDISFLSEEEWRAEVNVLLDDLVDEDGNVKRSTDLRSDAGVAWSKIHAVYPSITHDILARLSVDQILARDNTVRRTLGTTKRIVAKNSAQFSQEIAKFIDSKERKRGEKSKGNDKKGKDKAGIKKLEQDPFGPAWWPLIRQVKIRCKAFALSTGAILVDLPGTADANQARNVIAKDYMKKCDCIWILAPITRAVDDKVAKDLLGDAWKTQVAMDGNYDASTITFVATKTDDLSCREIIDAMNLHNDSELEDIAERLERCGEDITEWKHKKQDAETACKSIEKSLKEIRAISAEQKKHLEALENNEDFVSRLSSIPPSTSGHKRKRSANDKLSSSPKRRKSAVLDSEDDELYTDEDNVDDSDKNDMDVDSDEEDDDEVIVVESDSDEDSHGAKEGDKSDVDDAGPDAGDDAVELLHKQIEQTKAAMLAEREALNNARKQKKEATDKLSSLKKHLADIQREKNRFCSLQRSEYSREVLKEDFRQGLKSFDDDNAEQRDPENFDPSVELRDYQQIDLPVFTCSSRDYIRANQQVTGDGEPTCFTDIEDTGIPSLQKWCQTLTITSRERAARNFIVHLKTWASSVSGYLQGIGEVTETDRKAMRALWESTPEEEEAGVLGLGANWLHSDEDMLELQRLLGGHVADQLYGFNARPAGKEPNLDARGEPIGVSHRLKKMFQSIVEKCVTDLQEKFHIGLEEKCRQGAANATASAVATLDAFAASMHWGTYRATLRRLGCFRQDLNEELLGPFTKNIASSWAKIFESDLLTAFEAAAVSAIDRLLRELEISAPNGLKDRVKQQGEGCREEAHVALQKTVGVVGETLQSQQKEQWKRGAEGVSLVKKGASFHDFVSANKDDIFVDGTDVILGQLDQAAKAVGISLDAHMLELAQKCEVSLSVLWESSRDDPEQARVRQETVHIVSEVLRQVTMWQTAERLRASA